MFTVNKGKAHVDRGMNIHRGLKTRAGAGVGDYTQIWRRARGEVSLPLTLDSPQIVTVMMALHHLATPITNYY